jgi:hypothetical protein
MLLVFMSGRGGSREGSGRPSAWNNKKTVAIRVPECFSEQILDYARQLDNGEISQAIDNVRNQKMLQMLKDALQYPTNSFGKGKTVLKEVVSILEIVQNQ